MYNDFALIYDRFQEIDYDSFIRFYESVFKDDSINKVIDLGCGTGEIGIRLAKSGYDVIGVDMSEEMLTAALDKSIDAGAADNIIFIHGDMTKFVYHGGADAVVSALDCVNYLTDRDDVISAFKCVYASLADGGVFIFDINSEYKLSRVLGDNTFVYDDDDAYCVWDCGYYPDEKICGFDLNFFIKAKDGSYTRYAEYQEERAYSIQEITEALTAAGFGSIEVFADLAFEPPADNSERIFFVAGK